MRLKTFFPNNQILKPAAAFLMAFCSLSYLLLIAARLSSLFGEGIFIYPAVMAVFILSAGWGGVCREGRDPETSAQSLRRLLWFELGLTFAGFLSIIGIDALLFDSLAVINLEAGGYGLAVAGGIGFLTGLAFQELYRFCSSSPGTDPTLGPIKLFAYLACACASVLCTMVFFPAMGFLKTSAFVAFLNLLLVILLLSFQHKNVRPVKRSRVWAFSALVGFFFAFFIYADKTENAILKRAYLGYRPAMLIAKKLAHSQEILVYMTRKDGWPILETEREILTKPNPYFIFGLQNGSLRFFLPFASQTDPEHTFLLDPYITLLPGINNLLILGGGDGLSARQATQYESIKSITIVEPDRVWVELARKNPYLLALTHHAFEDPRIKLHFMDAFQWVLRAGQHYDLIIVKAPSGTRNLKKTRTFSVQFFRDLKRILTEHGVIVITSDTISSQSKLAVQARTAREAGLFPLTGSYPGQEGTWGKLEQLILFHSENTRLSFLDDYQQKYPRHLKYGRKNLAQFGMMSYSLPNAGEHYLSFYDPLLSSLPGKKQLKLITEDYAAP